LARATSASPRTSLTTPVEVSDWVVNSARAGRPNFASASPTWSGSTFSPHSNSRWVVSAPNPAHISAQRWPNLPADATTAGSPGTTRLATADSIAPDPEAAKESTSLPVWNTFGRRSSARS